MTARPDREWWSAAEIAAARLAGLPQSKRAVNAHAEKCGWQSAPGKARRRKGRGGGWEYHWTLLPRRAQVALFAEARDVPPEPRAVPREEAWAAFEALPERHKTTARARLDAIQKIEALEAGGLTRDQAVRDVARLGDASARTLWNWFTLISGVRPDDRLAYLAPAYARGSAGRAREVDPDFGAMIKSDYLRPEQPSLKSVYDRCVRIAGREGREVAPYHTVTRWLKREVSEVTRVLARKGIEAAKQMYPPQRRDRSQMHAMEAVNGDFHRFDVFVRFPAEAGMPEEIVRPQMAAWQDLFSGRLVAWRVDRTPNSHTVQASLGDLIEDWGIPERVLVDNGREFAAKMITGGSPTRYRFKVREDDIPGLLTTLGCQVHWAQPYSGQSKPIERAFRDFADRVSKHPAFDGAYTGNSVDAKPENYGNAAVPLERFLEVLAEEIEAWNTRGDRRTEVAWGRSFADVFDESYARAPIRKATAAQRRLWLMGAEGLRPNTRTGAISFLGNEYWAEWLHDHRGAKLVARFDRADLWAGLHLYALTGEYLGQAECRQKAGFFDIEAARSHQKARKGWLKAERERLAAHRALDAAELAERGAPVLPPEAPRPEAKVVRLVQGPAPRRPAPEPVDDAAHAAFVADFEAAAARRQQPETTDDPRALFARSLEMEATLRDGGTLTRDQRRWLASYQSTPDYRTWSALYAEHGSDVLSR